VNHYVSAVAVVGVRVRGLAGIGVAELVIVVVL
jgi:hypothetical protein